MASARREVPASGGAVTDCLVDHAAVEVEQGAGRAEAKRLVGENQGFDVATVGVQLPGQGVGGVDALAADPFRLGGGQALVEVDAVVG